MDQKINKYMNKIKMDNKITAFINLLIFFIFYKSFMLHLFNQKYSKMVMLWNIIRI